VPARFHHYNLAGTKLLSGPEGCLEMIIINGHEVTLHANSKVTVDLLRA
jgi:hypothetical protein